MKSISQLFLRHAARLGAGLILAGSAVHASEDDFPNFENYIKVSGQAAFISGDKAAMQSRTQQSSDGGVGIQDLHYAKDTSKTTTITADGHALAGSEDYLGKINVTKNDVGSVEVGYKRFRTFYDGAAGFFPLSNQWLKLSNEDLHIDRAKFWVEANLALPNAPVVTLRYTNELRDGRKDSLTWGSSDLAGLPFTVAPNPVTEIRKGTPAYLQVGERHEAVELSFRHTIRQTTVLLTLLGDRTNNLDTRFVTLFPGEVIPWSIASLATAAQPAAKAALAPANWNNEQAIAQSDGSRTKTSGFTLETETAVTDKLTLRAGGSYELVYNEISGQRPLITTTATPAGIVPVATATFQNLVGGAHVKELKGNISLNYRPIPTLTMLFGLKAENEFVRGTSTYNVLAATGTPAVIVTSTPRFDFGKLHQNSQTPVLDVRYTGIKDLALYFSGSKRNVSGVENDTSAFNPLTATAGTVALNNVGENHGDYTLGANWRQSAWLNLRAEVFTKSHKDDTTGFGVQLGDYYLLDSQVKGYKLTAIVRPLAQVSSTTRFVSQHSRAQVTGFLPTYPAFDSLNGRNYILSESVDFAPNASCYLQVNGTAVYNVIDTIYPRAGLTVATATVNAFDTNRVLQNSNNNYLTGSVLTGWTMSKTTDAQVQFTYYKADDGNPVVAAFTQPYGVAIKDTTVTLGLKHKFSARWLGNAKIGYFDSKNDTTGGFANFRGPIAYLSFEHAL